jgi:hypothetical protein
MNRSSSFSPYQQGARTPRNSARAAQGAADFLRGHEKMASLLPAVSRMAALQKDCAAVLPDMFSACGVLQFESEQLVLSVPNAALTARLKQMLPKLQDALLKRGWQVSAIRLRVQVGKYRKDNPGQAIEISRSGDIGSFKSRHDPGRIAAQCCFKSRNQRAGAAPSWHEIDD